MPTSFKLFLFIVFFLIPTLCNAEKMLLDVNILVTVPDAGGNDNFHTGKILSVKYNYYFFPWLAATSGIFTSEEILDEIQEDVVGRYQASFKTKGLTIGARFENKISPRNKVYARLGLLLYDTKVNVEEYFAPGLPAGNRSASTTGTGYFVGFGWAHSFTPKILFQLELGNQTQRNLFDGKIDADRVFNLSSSGYSIGLAYAF